MGTGSPRRSLHDRRGRSPARFPSALRSGHPGRGAGVDAAFAGESLGGSGRSFARLSAWWLTCRNLAERCGISHRSTGTFRGSIARRAVHGHPRGGALPISPGLCGRARRRRWLSEGAWEAAHDSPSSSRLLPSREKGPAGTGARFPPSRERRPPDARTTYTTNVRLAGLWRNGHLSSLVWGLAYVGDGMTLGRFANGPYIQTHTPPPITLILTFSPQRRRDCRLRGI